jgi:hypothetical protein
MGATMQQLLVLISKDFLKLVAIAFLIATPIAWWFMGNWLKQYPYRVHLQLWLFAAVGIMTLLLALLIVGLNTFRAAIMSPVKSLRSE